MQWSASILPSDASLFEGSCLLGWGPALATVAAEPFPKTLLHAFPLVFFWEGVEKTMFFFKCMGYMVCILLDILAAKRDPTPGNDYFFGRYT